MNFTISVDGLELSVVETAEVNCTMLLNGILPDHVSVFRWWLTMLCLLSHLRHQEKE